MNKTITDTMTVLNGRTDSLNQILLAQNADFTVIATTALKNNREICGYILKTDKSNCCPVIYYDPAWDTIPDNTLAQNLMKMFDEHFCESIDIATYLDQEYVRNNIKIRIISNRNIDNLIKNDVAYTPLLDMVIIYYLPFGSQPSDGVASVKLTNNLMEKIGISMDEAYECSIQNMEKDATCDSMFNILKDRFHEDFMLDCDDKMYIVSNHENVYGASAILCPSVVKHLQELMGSQFAILPSSVHECIIVPYESKETLDMYVAMVHEVNQTLDEDDILTENVYYYDNDKLCCVIG